MTIYELKKEGITELIRISNNYAPQSYRYEVLKGVIDFIQDALTRYYTEEAVYGDKFNDDKVEIYIIRMGEFDFYKIGFSKCGIKQRLKDLQVGNPLKLSVVKTIEGTIKFERIIHEIFEKIGSKRLLGEWFEIKKEDLDKFINNLY